MGKASKIAIVAGLAIVVAIVIATKKAGMTFSLQSPTTQKALQLPRLVDLGSTTCVPCRMMMPVLEELSREYAGRFQVEFVNVNQTPELAKSYEIRLIPTQVFFDASGREVWRHEGFISKADILAKWKELGVVLADVSPVSQPSTSPSQPASGALHDVNAALSAAVVNDVYPGLTSGGLAFAKLVELPQGVMLRAGELTVTEKDIADEILRRSAGMQEQLRKNAIFVAEQWITHQLLLAEARTESAPLAADADELSLVQDSLQRRFDHVKVSDEEIDEFYRNNKDVVGDAALDVTRPKIVQYLRQQKQQALVAEHVRTLGLRTVIEVSAPWAQQQSVTARDNPVDKARMNGRPSLVDFGAKGNPPCDAMAASLESLVKKYDGRANVVFVSVQDEPILAARYGVDSIPMQIFFDRKGNEVSRHSGFLPQEELEKRLAELEKK